MNYPSVKSIMEIKDVTLEQAKQIRAILKMKSVEAVCEVSKAANEYVDSCYHVPPLKLVKLTAIDCLIGTFGVEYIRGKGTQRTPSIDYCNAGDCYNVTIYRVHGRYRVGCVADIVEKGNYD